MCSSDLFYEQDISIARELASRFQDPRVQVVDKALSIEETLAYTKAFDFVIGMRLHSLIMAVAVDTPVVAISYDPKVENIMADMQIPYCLKLEDMTPEALRKATEAVSDHLEEVRSAMEKVYKAQLPKVYMPLSFIKESLEGGK